MTNKKVTNDKYRRPIRGAKTPGESYSHFGRKTDQLNQAVEKPVALMREPSSEAAIHNSLAGRRKT
jgi:hypothetical protein